MTNPQSFSKLVSIIVPCMNEEDSIGDVLKRLHAVLPEAEILVIDGGNDSTEAKITDLNKGGSKILYHRHSNDRGKGHAIRTGIQLATRPYIAQLDSDLQFWPEDLIPLLQILINDEADFVCGSRFLPRSVRGKKSVPGIRQLGNRLINIYSSLLIGKIFTDILAGIKIWKREVTESFFLQSDSFCYEAELPIKALRQGFRVVEAPVRTEPRLHGSTSVNVMKTGLQLLGAIPRFRWQNQNGKHYN